MKKLLHIILVSCIFVISLGCTSPTVKLRRAYVTGNEKNTKNYQYKKVGHKDTVQLSTTTHVTNENAIKRNIGNLVYGDGTTVHIGILIEKDSNQAQAIPRQMPSLWKFWQGHYPKNCSVQKGISCSIPAQGDKLILSFTYDSIPLGKTPFYLVFSPLFLGINIPSTLRGIVQPRIFSFDMKKPVAHLQLEDDVAYDGSTELIRIKHTITPSILYLSCKSGKCMAVDENQQIVNRLVWKQEFSYNTTRLKQLLNEEVEQEKQRKIQEERRKRQEERRKRQEEARKRAAAAREERERKQRLADQNEVCKALYNNLYVQGGLHTLDPIGKAKFLRLWKDYECSGWQSDQINKYLYY